MRVLARQTERKSVNSLFIAKCCIIIFTDYGHTNDKSRNLCSPISNLNPNLAEKDPKCLKTFQTKSSRFLKKCSLWVSVVRDHIDFGS